MRVRPHQSAAWRMVIWRKSALSEFQTLILSAARGVVLAQPPQMTHQAQRSPERKVALSW